MEFPLYVTCCFFIAALNNLLLCLVVFSLISMCLGMSLLGFILYGTLCASHTWLAISFSMLGKFSTIIASKKSLIPFLFLFFFWDPYNSNVGPFNLVPDVSETILSSFNSFYFILHKLFPPLYLPAHRFILLLQIFCYWVLLEYF